MALAADIVDTISGTFALPMMATVGLTWRSKLPAFF
jgi:hypothetical protein